jgi:cysteinyl-tRNA synthetase
VINVRAALAAFPAESVRLYYLQNHYRSSLPWNEDVLPEALAMLARLYEAREKADSMGGSEEADHVAKELGKDALDVLSLGREFEANFHKTMDYDFNTGKALGFLFRLARAVNRFAGHKKARRRGGPVVAPALAAFRLVADALGLLSMDTSDFHEEVKAKRLAALGVSRDEVEALLKERVEARAEKNWERADAIRGELDARNIQVMDSAEGVEWRVRMIAPTDES